MLWVLLFAVALAVLAVVWYIQQPSGSSSGLPYQKQKSVLTPAERQFYEALKPAVGMQYVVGIKMRMADLLSVTAKGSDYQSARNRISQKHVDFVLLSAETLTPVVAIELDDSSHAKEKRKQRDALVDQIYTAAGLPILHVPVTGKYSSQQLAALIQSKIEPPAPTAQKRGS